MKSLVYRNELLELPGKRAACGKQIDYRVFPDNTPEQVQALVASLYALADRLARLEASIEAIFAQTDKGELSTADYKNLYRLLGSYRGLSEAAIGYAQLAEGINWAPWREARF